MITYDKTCKECSNAFEAVRVNAKFCGEDCRRSHKRKRSTFSTTCQLCGVDFEFVDSKSGALKRLYCSKSCAVTINNVTSPKRKKTEKVRTDLKEGNCVYCGVHITGPYNKKFCSQPCRDKFNYDPVYKNKKDQCSMCAGQKSVASSFCTVCSGKVKKNLRIENWKTGQWSGSQPKHTHLLSKTIRDYLLEYSEYTCSKCGFNTPHPDDNKTILEINHIDGNGSNHSPDNLEVICPNCHALTSSYRGRNSGNGRPYRYK